LVVGARREEAEREEADGKKRIERQTTSINKTHNGNSFPTSALD
jgi:hypothetical protein